MVGQKKLFTPGPLNTSDTVKAAMSIDMGSRDEAFISIIADIRQRLVELAHGDASYTAIPMQGSGTFGIEAVIATVIAPSDRLLVLVNGAYGRRLAHIASCYDVAVDVYECAENETHDATQVQHMLRDSNFTHLAIVHCETTSGVLNPVQKLSQIGREQGCQIIVDAMSSFGGMAFSLQDTPVDYLISSSNKCLQGVPGFAFVIAKRDALSQVQHRCRSVSLNLTEQLAGLEANGQFRFTPPTHAMLAFHQALNELDAEGGVEKRAERYRANHEALIAGMRALGFREYVPEKLQSHIITSFHYPTDASFRFDEFYRLLSEQGILIYPGKLTGVDCFRIGNIGHLFVEDIQSLLAAVKHALAEMSVNAATS